MTVHPNSIKAYKEALASGLLNEHDAIVTLELIQEGDGTNLEMEVSVHKKGIRLIKPGVRGLQPSLNSLVKRGIVGVAGHRHCKISKKWVMVYTFLGFDNIKKIPKSTKPTKAQISKFLDEVLSISNSLSDEALDVWVYLADKHGSKKRKK